jgi:aspartyl/glutamyl-tRNA(Asn/Gln) amidotransferase C subunit
MKITEKDVLYVAGLANLALTDEERTRMVRDLNSILEYVDRLNQLDTENVSPMAQTSDKIGIDESRLDCANLCFMRRLWQALPTAMKFSSVSPRLLSVPDGLRANESEHSHDR